jgi:hypothetical protein
MCPFRSLHAHFYISILTLCELSDKYIESHLILLSHDRIAQHWLQFGHISYFIRIDVDKLLEL